MEHAPREVPTGASSFAYGSWTPTARQENQQRKNSLTWLSLHELLCMVQTWKLCSCNPSKTKWTNCSHTHAHTNTQMLLCPGFHWDNSDLYFHFVTKVEPVSISDCFPGPMRNWSLHNFHLIVGDGAETKANLSVFCSMSVMVLGCKHLSLLK